MKKGIIKKIDNSKRNFLTGSVTLAGVLPQRRYCQLQLQMQIIKIQAQKVYQILLAGKIEML